DGGLAQGRPGPARARTRRGLRDLQVRRRPQPFVRQLAEVSAAAYRGPVGRVQATLINRTTWPDGPGRGLIAGLLRSDREGPRSVGAESRAPFLSSFCKSRGPHASIDIRQITPQPLPDLRPVCLGGAPGRVLPLAGCSGAARGREARA